MLNTRIRTSFIGMYYANKENKCIPEFCKINKYSGSD